mmetsp:Transcript_11766/g.41558  ORF Transcript_11766/g.41558 Transcript_11766/m.41558 type:complete len:317 (-) Transcript_11766:893-1843(-)
MTQQSRLRAVMAPPPIFATTSRGTVKVQLCPRSIWRMRPSACISLSLHMPGPMVSTAAASLRSFMSAPRQWASSKKTMASLSRMGEHSSGHSRPRRFRRTQWLPSKKKTTPRSGESSGRSSRRRAATSALLSPAMSAPASMSAAAPDSTTSASVSSATACWPPRQTTRCLAAIASILPLVEKSAVSKGACCLTWSGSRRLLSFVPEKPLASPSTRFHALAIKRAGNCIVSRGSTQWFSQKSTARVLCANAKTSAATSASLERSIFATESSIAALAQSRRGRDCASHSLYSHACATAPSSSSVFTASVTSPRERPSP